MSEQEKLLHKIQEVLKAGYLNSANEYGSNGKANPANGISDIGFLEAVEGHVGYCETPITMDRQSSFALRFGVRVASSKNGNRTPKIKSIQIVIHEFY